MMRPRARPENIKKKKKKSGAPTKSLRPRARPEMIGGMPGGSTRGIDPMENYGPEGVKRLTGGMKAGGMAKKGYKAGGKMKKGYKAGGKLEMVKNKQGNTVPFYAADGKGKMKAGGKVKKGYAAGGKAKGAAKGGKVRGAGIARKGVRPAKMI